MLKPKTTVILLLSILALGALIGVYRLSEKSYWDDELLSIYHAKSLTDVPALLALQVGNAHPPLYFLLLRFWLMPGGQSEGWTRLLSVLLGLPAIGLTFLIGRRLSGPKAGLWAAFLYTVMPLMLIYNRELRMYSLFTTLSCLSLYLLLRALDEGKFADWAVYSLATFLTLVTHYHGLLVLLAQGIYVLADVLRSKRRLQQVLRFSIAAGAALILFLPFLPALLKAFAAKSVMWQADANSGLIAVAYLAFSLALGQTIMPWDPLAWVGAIGFGLLLIAGLIAYKKNVKLTTVVLSYAPIVFIVGPIASHNMPRYYLFLVPLLCLFLAHALTEAKKKTFAFAVFLLLAASWGVSGYNYFAGREFHVMATVDPSREVAEYLSKAAAPEDAVIGGTQSFRMYYLPQFALSNPVGASLQQFAQDHDALPPTVWLVVYNPISTEKSKIAIRELADKDGYRQTDLRRFKHDPNYAQKQKYFRKDFAEYRIDVFRFKKTDAAGPERQPPKVLR